MVKASINGSGADNIENQRPPKIPAAELNFYGASHGNPSLARIEGLEGMIK